MGAGVAGAPAPEVRWTPHPGFQRRFLSCAAFEALGGGAAGPGKTDCLVMQAVRYAQHPATRALFLRTRYKDLLDVQDRMMALWPALGARWEASESRWRWPSGATVEMGYGANLRELGAYLGREFTAVLFDEVGLLPEAAGWLQLMSRVRSTESSVPLRMRATANPGGPGHAWLKARFVTPTEGGRALARDPDTGHTIAYVPGLGRDNPSLPASYWTRLRALPDLLRRAWLDGDWDVAAGLAFPDLDPAVHLRPAPAVQPWWVQWGGFDWGFAHWAVCVHLARDERGVVWVLDAVWVRRSYPDQIAEAIQEQLPVRSMRPIYAGLDVRQKREAEGNVGPSVAQKMAEGGVPLTDADQDRVQGYAAVLDLIAWRGRGPGQAVLEGGVEVRADIEPRLRFADTPGCRRLVTHLQAQVLDPLDPRRVLKVNADPDTGEGGDDGYDALRYGLLSHQRVVNDPALDRQVRAWDPAVLAHEAEQRRHDGRQRRPDRPAGLPEWARLGNVEEV